MMMRFVGGGFVVLSTALMVNVLACGSDSGGAAGGGGKAEMGGAGGMAGMGGAGGTGDIYTGTQKCADFLTSTDPTTVTTWSMTEVDTDFDSAASWDAYTALNACACEASGSCGKLYCDNTQTGLATPNFCNASKALTQCDTCLTTNCQTELTDCAAN